MLGTLRNRFAPTFTDGVSNLYADTIESTGF